MILASIAATLATVKTATELCSSLLEKLSDGKRREELFEIQRLIAVLAANAASIQAEYAELEACKDNIEKELLKYKEWDSKASQYEFREISPGWRVIAPKASSAKPGETPHYFCPNCFGSKKESVLQGINLEAIHYECTTKCGFETAGTYGTESSAIRVINPGIRSRH